MTDEHADPDTVGRSTHVALTALQRCIEQGEVAMSKNTIKTSTAYPIARPAGDTTHVKQPKTIKGGK